MVEERVKPGFDARVQYYDVLKGELSAMREAARVGAPRAWYRALRGVFNMLAPYLNKDVKDELLTDLKRVGASFTREPSNVPPEYVYSREETLLDLDGRLHDAARDIFLPVGEEGKAIDWDKLKEGGG